MRYDACIVIVNVQFKQPLLHDYLCWMKRWRQQPTHSHHHTVCDMRVAQCTHAHTSSMHLQMALSLPLCVHMTMYLSLCL